MNFDRGFWIKTLQENGFKIESTIYPLTTDIREAIRRHGIIVENIEVLYDNFPVQIVYVNVVAPQNRENGYRITRNQAGFIVWVIRDLNIISAFPVFIISDGHDSYVFTSIINRETGEPETYLIKHFSGKLTPAQRKMLKYLVEEVADAFKDEYRWFWLNIGNQEV